MRSRRPRPRLTLGHADPAKRRVDEESVCQYAFVDAATGSAEKAGGDDFKVIVGGVRESASAVAISERPDRVDICLKIFVRLDEAVPVDLHPRSVQPEIFGIWFAANGG